MSELVVAPVVLPLVVAVLTLPAGRYPRVQAALSVGGTVAYAAVAAALAAAVLSEGVLVYQAGNWPPPLGIVLVADALAAFMLALTAVVAVPVALFSVGHVGAFGQRLSYHSLFQFVLVGVSGAFLTGDLFNLFVWFEVMLMATYALVAFEGGAEDTWAALQYLVLNLVGSALMLLAVGGLYAVTGTLNMADMARRLAEPTAYGIDPAPALGLSALLFAVFALKAGIVPFQFWVPPAYSAAPAPVAALLAGVTKKVGVYAIIRLYFVVFVAADVGGATVLGFYGVVLLVAAAASIVLGGVAAVERDTLEGVLAYSSIGQVGFIVLPLAVGALVDTPAVLRAAVAATLVYALNHAVAKGLLFLTAGALADAAGTTRLSELGGLAGRTPVLSGAFLLGALALVGIPPLSGFFGKLLVFETAVVAGPTGAAGGLALAVALLGALLTVAYTSNAWNRGFWGGETPMVGAASTSVSDLVLLGAFAAVLLAIGLGFDPVYEFAAAAADAVAAPDRYVGAVLGGGGS